MFKVSKLNKAEQGAKIQMCARKWKQIPTWSENV
jgi:hypothetical protein